MMKFYVNEYIKKYKDVTLSINEALKDASLVKGEVIFDGIYKCYTINIPSNICIYLSDKTKIVMGDNLDLFYNINVLRNREDTEVYKDSSYNGMPSKYFIYAKDSENIKIYGSGIIDGSEEIFYGSINNKDYIEGKFYPRIPLIFMENCKNISISGVTLQRSAFWTLHLVGCDGVCIFNINILNNLRMVNSDGIDPDHCKNVVIKNSKIIAADDCVVLKTTEAYQKYGRCENITLSNLKLTSTSAAIKIGTETFCDICRVNVSNIDIIDSNRAISIQPRDKGNIYDILFDNINITTKRVNYKYWWGMAEAISITAVGRKEIEDIGVINNITFKNISSNGEGGIFIYGTLKNICNINISNMKLSINNTLDLYDLRPSNIGVFKDLYNPIYIKNAKNIILSNVILDNIEFEPYINNVDNFMIEKK